MSGHILTTFESISVAGTACDNMAPVSPPGIRWRCGQVKYKPSTISPCSTHAMSIGKAQASGNMVLNPIVLQLLSSPASPPPVFQCGRHCCQTSSMLLIDFLSVCHRHRCRQSRVAIKPISPDFISVSGTAVGIPWVSRNKVPTPLSFRCAVHRGHPRQVLQCGGHCCRASSIILLR